MKRTREQIKAEWMKKAEQEIDRLLDWEEKVDKPTLTQFENQVLTRRKALSEAMLDSAMAGQETHQLAESVKCPKCGQPTENKGLHTKEVETRAGTLRLRRQYHYCAHCHVGFFPLG
jgi:DNA repair exonuclease SbcCD ATPase subunit